jgi:signal transduction histidine kinase/CheY-like chemotaxis protein
MKSKSNNIPVKVFVSYIALAALIFSVGWILYSENKVFSQVESKLNLEENKVLKISKLFSNVYETESLARRTIQSNSETDFKNYLLETDSLGLRIDSLKSIVSSKYQISLLDSVSVLLSDKTQNIKKLQIIKSQNTDETSVKNAISELDKLEFSLSKLRLKDFHKNPDNLSTYQRTVLQNYVEYLNKNIPDDSTNTLSKKASDSILAASKRLLNSVKLKTERKRNALNLEEKKLLNNEILISDQLRKVLHLIEREVIVYSIKNNNEKDKSLKRINEIVTIAAIVGLLLTVFFSILIANDFSKTQLYKKQLEVANFKTRNLLKSREQLISTVSHDLKTPLSTIAGYTELLDNSNLTTKQAYFTTNIKNSVDYITRLVKDLLDFSQIEAGKIMIEAKPFSLKNTIDTVSKNIQSVYSQKNIRLVLNIDEELNKPILGDEFRLQQVLTNLIGNAYKFTNEGFINISAELLNNKNTVLISINDSGIGIEQDSQELIFEEFAQANESIEKTFGGTGLGLSISKKITHLLGGDLYLKESSLKGSCFEIRLPIIFAPSNQILTTKTVMYIPEVQGKTIIVVDDDTDLLQLTTQVLKRHYNVLSFSDANEAIKTINKTAFDLLITDIQMPLIDGFTLVSTIKNNHNSYYNNQPIIAMTGRTDLVESTYIKAGFTVVVSKPFTPAILLKTIDAIFLEKSIPDQDKITKNNDAPLFSLESLGSFLNNDKDEIRTIIESLIDTTKTNLIVLRENIELSNFEAVKQVAHKMGPMFRQIEANEIAGILRILETATLNSTEINDYYLHLEAKINYLFSEIMKVI